MNRQSVYLYSILILFSLIIIVPIYTTIIGGFKSIGELRVNILGLPESWIFDNYFDILLRTYTQYIFGHTVQIHPYSRICNYFEFGHTVQIHPYRRQQTN